VRLETLGHRGELGVDLGHRLFERPVVGFQRGLAGVGDGRGRADAGDDVFALRIHQELAVEMFLAGGGIAGEERPCRESPMLPKTMDWTLTAVPHDPEMPLRRR
jgi:hypothetical protein